MLERADVKKQIVNRWGIGILNGDQIDRSRLAAIVFGHGDAKADALQVLESITHPKINDEIARRTLQATNEGKQACVLDAPVMFKAGWVRKCDFVVFVDASDAVRQQRAKIRGWTVQQLHERERNQTSLELKRAAGTHIIDNSNSKTATYKQAVKIWLDLGLSLPQELYDPATLFNINN